MCKYVQEIFRLRYYVKQFKSFHSNTFICDIGLLNSSPQHILPIGHDFCSHTTECFNVSFILPIICSFFFFFFRLSVILNVKDIYFLTQTHNSHYLANLPSIIFQTVFCNIRCDFFRKFPSGPQDPTHTPLIFVQFWLP